MNEASGADRRIIRTRLALREALIGLIEEKGFENLSVKDLTSRAGISRGTFYLHYRDKYDLLERTVEDVMQDFETYYQQSIQKTSIDPANPSAPLPVLVSFFEYAKNNTGLVNAYWDEKGEAAFQALLKKKIEANIYSTGLLAGVKKEDLSVPAEYLFSYIVSANIGVVKTWLENGCKESPKEMAAILSKIIYHGILHSAGIRPDKPPAV